MESFCTSCDFHLIHLKRIIFYEMKYYFEKTLTCSLDEAIERVTEELKKAGFGITIGSPALIYNLDLNEGTLVYQENHPKAFYDSMEFWNDQEGIAMLLFSKFRIHKQKLLRLTPLHLCKQLGMKNWQVWLPKFNKN